MSQDWGQMLVNAQIDINRAVFEMNRPGGVPPEPSDLVYIRDKVRAAVGSLQECAQMIPGAQLELRMTDEQVDADEAAD